MYQSLIGTLNYVTNTTRPDIAFSVNLLARRTQNATIADLKRAKRVLTYLRDTSEMGITMFKRNHIGKAEVQVFVDSSYANGEGRRSIFGYVIVMDGNIICYKSKLEPIVAQSSCEAEYIALTFSIKELLWIENVCFGS